MHAYPEYPHILKTQGAAILITTSQGAQHDANDLLHAQLGIQIVSDFGGVRFSFMLSDPQDIHALISGFLWRKLSKSYQSYCNILATVLDACGQDFVFWAPILGLEHNLVLAGAKRPIDTPRLLP